MTEKKRIDWSAAEGEPVQPVNLFVAQSSPNTYILTLGFIAPPIILDSEDQDRVDAMKSIPARFVARVLLSPADMRELSNVLLTNLAKREKHEAKK